MKLRQWIGLGAALLLAVSLAACAGGGASGTDTSAPDASGGSTKPAESAASEPAASEPSVPDGTTASPDAGTTAPTSATEESQPHITFRDTSAGGGSIGSWWWNNSQIRNDATCTKYLQFLQDNQVTEVYASLGGMKAQQITEFVRKAAGYGIRVAWLSGDASWIESGSTGIVDDYLAYQSSAPADARLYALHLDVEPHQLDLFREDRARAMQLFADFIGKVAAQLHAAGEVIEWDIPFWLEDDTVTVDGESVKLLTHLARVSDTLCLMSYRDKASQILGVSKEEIAAGETYGCKIICGVETYSKEGNAVSFMEEGKTVMYRELETVYTTLKTKSLTAYGVAIHHVDKWYKLKN